MSQALPVTIAGIPLLVAHPEETAGALPVVLWCHGFRADALAHAAELERCAALGMLAVGIDAPEHGARRSDDLDARVSAAAATGGALPLMLDLAMRGVAEFPLLIEGLSAQYAVDPTRISLVGVSMGAYQAYHAIARRLPLRAVVALLGSPEWPHHASPHLALEPFRDVALLSITAGADVHVPPAAAHRLHVELAMRCPQGRHRYHELHGAEHLTTGPQWDEAMRETRSWLSAMG